MKELQEYIHNQTDKTKIARIWRLKSTYNFSNGEKFVSYNKECFASKELIDDTISFYKENCNKLPEGIQSIEYDAEEDIIEFVI